MICRKIYRENLTSTISNSTVNLIDQNALKKDEGCVRWKCFRLTSVFHSWLGPLVLKSLVSGLLKVLLSICSIIIKLASLLKIWSFIAKWREAGVVSPLYTSLRWLFSLKLKSVSALPTYCMWHFLHSKRWMTKSVAVDLVENYNYPSILFATKWMCVLYL